MIRPLFASLLLSITWAAPPTAAAAPATVDQTLAQAQGFGLRALQDGNHWNMPLYMGTTYVSQYYLLRAWLGQAPSGASRDFAAFDEARFQQILLTTQLPDGSWQQVADPNLGSGSLDATAMNYWALKSMGQSPAGPALSRARAFIVAHGGIEKTSTFARIVFALFGQLSWDTLPSVPLLFINPHNPGFMNLEQFPQWVRPHIVPIAYLRSQRVQRNLGPRFAIPELHAAGKTTPAPDARPQTSLKLRSVVDQILKAQVQRGSWGGYTSATLFSLAALDDYAKLSKDPSAQSLIENAQARGIQFVDSLYVDPSNPNAYLGTVCDGRFWDSILILQGMASADPTLPELTRASAFLQNAQVANGGIPFGYEFESTPDLDDTAELITTLVRLDQAHPDTSTEAHIQAARDWLISMQNDDGGWGAFDRNNEGNAFLDAMASGLSDSATLFDPSTPDVTGHALEALAATGLNVKNSESVRKAVSYLQATPDPMFGIWPGRWGVNYIYGTSAAVSGMLRAGVSPNDGRVRIALGWIRSRQNPDGGFGETTHSDLNIGEAGKGISTPSQTAWALMAFVRGGMGSSAAAQAAAAYLVRTANPEGGWTDHSVVGTGHSGIVYLFYPSYSLAFPMIALSEYRDALAKRAALP